MCAIRSNFNILSSSFLQTSLFWEFLGPERGGGGTHCLSGSLILQFKLPGKSVWVLKEEHMEVQHNSGLIIYYNPLYPELNAFLFWIKILFILN